ncbi:unnamed protein product [Oncorhynchus mykiss]|uniref:Secretogranin-3 n=1 Tax=Oncorhynchus mykiss TaxID=8022 RepID=A0A061A708_ONCMY|nr:unnamed protein product [Oncorhynchus mykiss]
MASKGMGVLLLLGIFAVTVSQISAFPTPAEDDKAVVYNRRLTEERPIQEQIAEADDVKAAVESAGKWILLRQSINIVITYI